MEEDPQTGSSEHADETRGLVIRVAIFLVPKEAWERTFKVEALTRGSSGKGKGGADHQRSPMKNRYQSILFVECLLLFVCGCSSPLRPPPKAARSYQSLLQWSQESGMPGAILLVRTPTTNFLGSVGWADKKRKIPMRPNHAFRIGSVTKTFTGIVTAQLHTEGRLNTDAVMTNYLPVSISSHIPNSDRITLRQMTRHTSGIYNYNDSLAYMLCRGVLNRRGKWPPSREIKYAYDKPARFAPGEGWEYSNSNFLLLGLMIDQLTGHHHSVEIRNRILSPLKLTNTYYELSEPARGELAHGYEGILAFGRMPPTGRRLSEATRDW
jgi:D-alanyl-D-alanine carboxypeptidase